MRDEIRTSVRIAEEMLTHTDENEIETRISDAIADLLVLCHEREINGADVVVSAIAHFAASYIEDMDSDEAQEWLYKELFPYTGTREFAEYCADRAIVLSGHSGKVATPEWGV